MNDTNTLEVYNYSLPNELIAQYPCDIRDESRLLCYDKETKSISHKHFKDLTEILNKNDVLILNNTKVIPARFYADIRPLTHDLREKSKQVEIVLVRPLSADNLTWLVIAGPQKKLRTTNKVYVEISDNQSKTYDAQLTTQIDIEVINDQTIKFKSSDDLKKILNGVGKLPLPHYIERKNENIDLERYQTVFAEVEGAIAAPTAALHFTDTLINNLKEKGVQIHYITLHVGPGTFMPIRTDNINEHNLMPEEFSVNKDVWESILKAKKEERRIIACGTTTTRTLEYLASQNSDLRPTTYDSNAAINSNNQKSKVESQSLSGLCNLYITPGYEFKVVDAIITNFHLPKTSLLLLVSAFMGWNNLQSVYDEAIKEKYRFYSYGDATFIS